MLVNNKPVDEPGMRIRWQTFCKLFATTQTFRFVSVRLTEVLVSKWKFQRANDAEVAWIDGQIAIRSKQFEREQTGPMDTDQKSRKSLLKTQKHWHWNQLTLSRSNIQSELSDGVLMWADDKVMIKPIDIENLTIEERVCKGYYRISSLLYTRLPEYGYS